MQSPSAVGRAHLPAYVLRWAWLRDWRSAPICRWWAFRIWQSWLRGPCASAAAPGAELLGSESVRAPESLRLPDDEPWFGAGTGWRQYAAALAETSARLTGCDPQRLPRARDAVLLAARAVAGGEAVPVEQAAPVYLRDRVTAR